MDTCFLSSARRKSRQIFWRLARRGEIKRSCGEREREKGRNELEVESVATRRGAERRLAQSAVNPVTSCRRGEESGAGVAEVSSLFIDLLNSAKEDREPLAV